MKLYKNESGRSIIEMLGVLAIIALLSLLGIRFFKSTAQTEKGNQIVKEIHKEITDYSLESLKKGISYLEHSKGDYLYSLYQLDNQFSELFITDKNWDCTVPTETARHIFAQLMPYNYIWQIGSENENYLTMEDFEKEAKTKEKYKQGFCIWVFFKTDLRPRPTPHFYMIHDNSAPTSCVEYESNPCDMCIEQEGWPVRYERLDFGAQCQPNSFCTVERKCEDLCENMECPTGTTCEKGFCLCPNGAEQCGGVCCGANELCGDATNSICVPVSSGCQTNADCQSNQYCKLTCNGYSANREGCCASFTGTCKNRSIPNAKTVDLDADGTAETKLWFSYNNDSTWSARNYCASLGKRLINLNNHPFDKTTLEVLKQTYGGGSVAFWTDNPINACHTTYVHLGVGAIQTTANGYTHNTYTAMRTICE